MSIDLEKARREQTRWMILVTLNAARPLGANEQLILSALQGVPLQVTAVELRRELDYLRDRKLVEIQHQDGPLWHAELTRYGVDVAEYTVDVEPGIARPQKELVTMPPRAKVDLLPEAVRHDLDRRLVSSGFGGYEALSAWLAEQGYQIGKSALGEYGQSLQRKLDAISASTKAAVLIADAAPDDADLRSAATMSLVQTELFNLLVALQEAQQEDDVADRIKLLSRAAKSIAEVSRASVNQKKWQDVVRGKAQAAADRVAKIARTGGLSVSQTNEIRSAILGISS